MKEREKILSDCLESHALGSSVPEPGQKAIHPKFSEELCVGLETAFQQNFNQTEEKSGEKRN